MTPELEAAIESGGQAEAIARQLGAKSGEWLKALEPVIKRFEVAAKFNANAVHNSDGSEAIAALLREMCRLLDNASLYKSAIEAFYDRATFPLPTKDD